MASESGDASLNSRLARTDELRLKNVTIKTFLPDPGVHHTKRTAGWRPPNLNAKAVVGTPYGRGAGENGSTVDGNWKERVEGRGGGPKTIETVVGTLLYL